MEGFVGRVNFTDAMDAELCQQAIVVNPFATTWDNLLNACKEHVPAFSGIRVSKTLRDRLLLLLKKRAACNAAEEKASGIEVPEPTDFERSLDELLLLKYEAERKKGEKKAAKQSVVAAAAIKEAALQGLAKRDVGEEAAVPGAGPAPAPVAGEPDTPTRKRRHPQAELVDYFKSRDASSDNESALRKEMFTDHVRLRDRELDIRKLELENEKEARNKELEVRKMEAENQRTFNQQILAMLVAKK